MNIDFKAVGNRIRDAREALKISQQELATMLDISTAAISMYESGERKIGLELLSKISSSLNVTIPELLEGYNKKPVYVSFRINHPNEKLSEVIKKALESAKEDD